MHKVEAAITINEGLPRLANPDMQRAREGM
jgi:hypothetical protein